MVHIGSVFSPLSGHRNAMLSCIKLFKKPINLQFCHCTTKEVVCLCNISFQAQKNKHKRFHTTSYGTAYFLTGSEPLELRVNFGGTASTKHSSPLPSSGTYRVVKSNRINDHEVFQIVFVRRVVPMPGYHVEGGEILSKQQGQRQRISTHSPPTCYTYAGHCSFPN